MCDNVNLLQHWHHKLRPFQHAIMEDWALWDSGYKVHKFRIVIGAMWLWQYTCAQFPYFSIVLFPDHDALLLATHGRSQSHHKAMWSHQWANSVEIRQSTNKPVSHCSFEFVSTVDLKVAQFYVYSNFDSFTEATICMLWAMPCNVPRPFWWISPCLSWYRDFWWIAGTIFVEMQKLTSAIPSEYGGVET